MELTKLQRSEYRRRMEELLLNIQKNQKDIKPNIEKVKLDPIYFIKNSKFHKYPSEEKFKISGHDKEISDHDKEIIITIIIRLINKYIDLLKNNDLILFDEKKDLKPFPAYGSNYQKLFKVIAGIRNLKPRRNFITAAQIRFPGDPPPENIDIYDPENIDIYDPENIDIYDPENMDIYDPENIDIYDPENIDIYDPENIDIYDPENMDIYDPRLGATLKESYYRAVARIRFPGNLPGDPPPENEDIYDPFLGDIKEDLHLLIEDNRFLMLPNGVEVKDYLSIRDILVHLIDTYKDII